MVQIIVMAIKVPLGHVMVCTVIETAELKLKQS